MMLVSITLLRFSNLLKTVTVTANGADSVYTVGHVSGNELGKSA